MNKKRTDKPKKSFYWRCKVALFLLSLIILTVIAVAYFRQPTDGVSLSRTVPLQPNAFRIQVSPLPRQDKSTFKAKGMALSEQEITQEIVNAKKNGLDDYALPLRVQSRSKGSAHVYSWAIQLGSFVRIDRANALRKQLLSAGFAAYIEKAPSLNNKSFFRVRVGPEVDRGRAEKLQHTLQERFKIRTFLVPNTL